MLSLLVVLAVMLMAVVVYWGSKCPSRLPREKLSLDAYRPKLGDIILTQARGFSVEKILFPTTMTHVALVYPLRANADPKDTVVLECAFDNHPAKRREYYRPCDWTKRHPIDGVRAMNLEDYVRTYPGTVYVREVQANLEYLRPRFEAAVSAAFGANVVFDRDIMSVSPIILASIVGQFVNFGIGKPRDKMFCSEFVAYVLNSIGILGDLKSHHSYWHIHFSSSGASDPRVLDQDAEVPVVYSPEVRLVP